MLQSKKVLRVFFTFVMIVSLFGSLPALAADTDSNMTAYNGKFTYVINRADIPRSGTTLPIYAVPSDTSWTPTYFDSATSAVNNVTWTRSGGSTAGITMGSESAYEIANGQYANCLTVNLSGSMLHGPASFRATNSFGGYVDISVIVTSTPNNDSANYATMDTVCQIYDPSGTLYQGIANSISASNHADSRSYVTVMDALAKMQNLNLVNSFTESYGYVNSITINNTPYSASGGDGWQYRVYHDSNYDGTYELVPLSVVLGASDMNVTLLGGSLNLVQWRYGSYSNSSLFPTSVTP